MPPEPETPLSMQPATVPSEADESPAPLPQPAASAASSVEMAAPNAHRLPTHRSMSDFSARRRDAHHLQPPSSALSIQVDASAGADSQPSSPASNSPSNSQLDQGRHSPQWFTAAQTAAAAEERR